MRKPYRFNFLIVLGTGPRILRLNVPRWTLYGGLMVQALAVSVLGAIYGDYLTLKLERNQLAGLQRQVAEQRAMIESFRRQLGGIRGEIATWRDLHARIREAFGPEAGPTRKGTGIGGGTGPLQVVSLRDPMDLPEELHRLAALVNEEGENLRALERILSRVGRVLVALPSRWPLRGGVNSEFGRRLSPWSGLPEFHRGIDITAPLGTDVKAPAPGTVVYTGIQAEYGLTLILDHGNDMKSLYGHLQKVHVSPGQRVERGQIIARSGNTGKSTGPHLHYEILVRGQPVNPRSFVWEH